MHFGGKIRRILVQSPPTAKDAGGELTGTWSTFYTTYAKIVDENANEGKTEGTEVMTVNRLFIIRYKSTLTNNMRILFDGDFWQIVGIKQIGNNEYTEISTILKSNT